MQEASQEPLLWLRYLEATSPLAGRPLIFYSLSASVLLFPYFMIEKGKGPAGARQRPLQFPFPICRKHPRNPCFGSGIWKQPLPWWGDRLFFIPCPPVFSFFLFYGYKKERAQPGPANAPCNSPFPYVGSTPGTPALAPASGSNLSLGRATVYFLFPVCQRSPFPSFMDTKRKGPSRDKALPGPFKKMRKRNTHMELSRFPSAFSSVF